MNQDLPPPPQELRPWYYQNLFLVVAFVMWPAWSILILRSPWNKGNFGILSGGMAWMVLIVGGVAIYLTAQAGRWDLIVLIVPPGLVLTFVLHVFWESYKKQHLGPYLPQYNNGATAMPEASGDRESAPSRPAATPRGRPRRRSRSRRSSRR